MKIFFSPEYTGTVYVKSSNNVMMDTIVVNTLGLINLLELRLGLHYEEVSEQERLAHYFDAVCIYMKANPQNIMATSFNISGLGTAKAMLLWRDDLCSADWNFEGAEVSERLAVLVGVEKYFHQKDSCDMVARLHVVTDQVNCRQLDYKQMIIRIPVAKELLKPAIRKLMSVLQAQGAKVEQIAGATDLGNNLSKVRQLIASGHKGKITLDKQDDSLQIWKFADEHAACEYLSYHEMKEVDVWVNADNKQMDNWLKLMGRATTGSVMVDATPQLTQLFVMGLGLFARPLNVHTLISWLQMPVHPLDKYFRSVLADIIVREGGYRNEVCREIIEQYIAGNFVYLDEEQKALPEEEQTRIRLQDQKRRQKLVEVFLPALDASPAINTDDVRLFVKELSVWTRQRVGHMVSEPGNEQWMEQLMAVTDMCDVFSILLETNKEDTIDYKIIDSWMSAVGQKGAYTHFVAERGCRIVVDHPAKIASVSEKTVWIGVDGEVNPVRECAFLFPTEREKLTEQGYILAWNEGLEADYYERMMLTPMRMTRGQLILVVRERVGEELTMKHPLIVRLEQQVENIQDFVHYPCIGTENKHKVDLVERDMLDAELHFNNAEKIQWTNCLSPTTIDTLVEHPFDYLLENLLDITYDGKARMSDVRTAKGNVAHAVIENLFAPRGNSRYSVSDEIETRIANEFEDIYAMAVEGKGAILQLAENKLVGKLLYNQLRHCLDVLLEIIRVNKLKVTGCEHRVKVEEVIGVIDMILEDKDGHLVAFDFKWTTWGKGYRAKLEENRSIQLEFYRWMLGQERKNRVERVAYFTMPDARLYSLEAFEGKHCTRLVPENRDNIVEQVHRSISYRKEQIASGIIETNGVFEELQYVKDTVADGLFPLKKAKEGTKEGNFFTNYGLFNK